MSNIKESPEGWRAWPLWLRAMLLIMALLLIAGSVAIAASLPAPSRNIEIAGAPTTDFMAYVIAYRNQGRLIGGTDTALAQSERICLGIDRLAFGDALAEDTDMIALASQTISVKLNGAPVPAEDMGYAYDPTIISIVDAAGQSIGDGHGTVGVCFRTASYPSGDYVGDVTIARPDNSTRYYEWAFTIN